AALGGFEAGCSRDDDVLAELADQRTPLVLEGLDRILTVRVDRPEDPDPDALDLLVPRDRLRLAADADDRSDSRFVVDDEAHEPFGRRAIRPLAGRGHPTLAQERAGRVEVAVRLFQRALAVHHPRARDVA